MAKKIGDSDAAASALNFKIQSQQPKVDPTKQVTDLNKLIPPAGTTAVDGKKSEVKNLAGGKSEEANELTKKSFGTVAPPVIEPKTSPIVDFAKKIEKLFKPEVKAPDFSKDKGSEQTKKTGLTDPTLFAANGSAEKVQAEAKDAVTNIKGNQATLALAKAAASTDTQLS
ncbi:MAG: hypothetical protein AABZ74_05345 [Cyanobacteriota bacterium]